MELRGFATLNSNDYYEVDGVGVLVMLTSERMIDAWESDRVSMRLTPDEAVVLAAELLKASDQARGALDPLPTTDREE